MRIFTKTGQLLRRLAHGSINRLWVQPLETRLIPRLSKSKPNRLQSSLLRLCTWCASAGRVCLEELSLVAIRWKGPDWSATYIGNGFSAEAMGDILFPEPPEEVESLPAALWQVRGLVQKFTQEGDLVVCELNEVLRLSPKGIEVSFASPQWIDLAIEGIDRPLEEVLAKVHPSNRSRIRRIEAQDYRYTITRSEADFDLFYHRMYVPYVETRHSGHGPIVRDRDYVHRFFEQGTLLLVKQDDELVSGSICQVTEDTCHGVLLGVMDGRYELVKQGAIVALVWSVIQWAREQGVRRFDFGACRPLVTNGVFVFKRQWGAQVFRAQDVHTRWNFYGKNLPAKLRDYLNEQGFITETPEGHLQVMLLDLSGAFDEDELARRLKTIAQYGLAGVVLISPTGERRLISCSEVVFDPAGSAHLQLHPAQTG